MCFLGLFPGTLSVRKSTKCCPFFDLVFWLVVWGGRLAFRQSSLLSVLGLLFTKFCGIKLSPLTRCALGIWFGVCCSTKCCSFFGLVFFGLSFLVFSWLCASSLYLNFVYYDKFWWTNWFTHISWFGFSSGCYNSTKYCRFTKDRVFMGRRLRNWLFSDSSPEPRFSFSGSGSALACFHSFSLAFLLSLSQSFSLSLSWQQAACSLTTT